MSISISAMTQVIIPKEPTEFDILILELTAFLLKKLGNNIVRVEKISGWDGSNVRIVIRSLDYLERVLDAIENFEREKGILGTIAPEVVLIDES